MLRRYLLTAEEKNIIRKMAGCVPIPVIAAVIGRKKATVMTYCVNNNLPTKLMLDDEDGLGVQVKRLKYPGGEETFTVWIPKTMKGHVKVVLV